MWGGGKKINSFYCSFAFIISEIAKKVAECFVENNFKIYLILQMRAALGRWSDSLHLIQQDPSKPDDILHLPISNLLFLFYYIKMMKFWFLTTFYLEKKQKNRYLLLF